MTPDLFDAMGWRCMRLGLLDVGLDLDYKARIESLEDRSFEKVKSIVMDLTRLDNLMADLNKLLLSIELGPNEDHAVFCDRIKDLLDVAGSFSWEERVCQSILRALPDDGAQKIRAHFAGVGTALDDPKAVLDFIRLNGHVCKGARLDPTRWHVQKFKLRPEPDVKSLAQSSTPSLERSTGKRSSHKHDRGRDRPAKRVDNGSSQAAKPKVLKNPCRRPGCEPDRHEQSQCWFIKDRDRWERAVQWRAQQPKQQTIQAVQHLCALEPGLAPTLKPLVSPAPRPNVLVAPPSHGETVSVPTPAKVDAPPSTPPAGIEFTPLEEKYAAHQASILQPAVMAAADSDLYMIDTIGNNVALMQVTDVVMGEPLLRYGRTLLFL
ncbi:hypothetical protein DFQ26_001618 [Actinomortierella ambigua]|nr:hypothetical protein DFQ26_001618 [Actinomortierella ambigua]